MVQLLSLKPACLTPVVSHVELQFAFATPPGVAHFSHAEMDANASLILSHKKLGDVAAHQLSQALKQNAALTSADLSGNKLTDKGIRVIIAALLQNPTLCVLNLEDNPKVTASGVKELCDALQRNTNLTSIKLNCKAFEEHAATISSYLQDNVRLHTVFLSGPCPLGEINSVVCRL